MLIPFVSHSKKFFCETDGCENRVMYFAAHIAVSGRGLIPSGA